MRNRLLKLMFAGLLLFSTGCSDRMDIEDVTIPLLTGYDLDSRNHLLVYANIPVFSKDAKKKSQELGVISKTLRESRGKDDAYVPGLFQGRKVLIILVSKRLLQHENWFNMMDVYFRDAKNSLTSRIAMYDGPLSEVIYLNPVNQPFLPILLRGMIDTKSMRSETVKTTMQELHRQMLEKGMTPYIAQIMLENQEVKLSGTALLDHQGRYATSLGYQETILLQILQNQAGQSVSLTISIPGEPKHGVLHLDKLSFSTGKTKTKIKTSYRQGKFQFDLNVNLSVGLTERLFPYDMRKKGKELENMIAGQLQKEFEDLIRKIQKKRIDPIGLGLHARANAYDAFKKAEDRWGEALAEADIHVRVKVKIGSKGAMR